MPRRAKLYNSGFTYHIVRRGNNSQACFFDDEVYQLYLDVLAEVMPNQRAGDKHQPVTAHNEYLKLGASIKLRRKAYKDLFKSTFGTYLAPTHRPMVYHRNRV